MIKKVFFAFLTSLCFSIPALADEGNGFLRGDVDQDGSVTISDVTALIDYLLNGQWPAEAPASEVFTVNGVSFTMITVEGGTFTMGATPEQGSEADGIEKPTHEVTLSSYSIGQTEVTQELWMAVMGSNPSEFTGDLNRPVETVSWNNCQEFIAKLNEMTGRQFRLPTEAEWEFAARGGLQSQGYKYAGGNTIDDVAWYYVNSYPHYDPSVERGTRPVGTKVPNELGLYDMSGNVSEWCQDWYGSYTGAAQTNPTGPSSGLYRIARGGSWFDFPHRIRVASRYYETPSYTGNIIGLRLAL